MLHRITHLLGINGGRSSTGWVGDALVTCFVCATCGKRESCGFYNTREGSRGEVPRTSPIYRIRGELDA